MCCVVCVVCVVLCCVVCVVLCCVVCVVCVVLCCRYKPNAPSGVDQTSPDNSHPANNNVRYALICQPVNNEFFS